MRRACGRRADRRAKRSGVCFAIAAKMASRSRRMASRSSAHCATCASGTVTFRPLRARNLRRFPTATTQLIQVDVELYLAAKGHEEVISTAVPSPCFLRGLAFAGQDRLGVGRLSGEVGACGHDAILIDHCASTYVGSCVCWSITEPYAVTFPLPPITFTVTRVL